MVILHSTKKVFELSNSSWQRTVSRELPGSIVTKTLRNRILTPIDALKELDFHTDFNNTSFIKISPTHQVYSYSSKVTSLRKFALFREKGKHYLKVIKYGRKPHHQIQRMREPNCRGFKLLFAKIWNLYFFFFLPEEISRIRVYLFLFIFFSG